MDSKQRAHATLHGAFERADTYDRIARRQLRYVYARVAADVAAAGLHDGARVLDVGTGPGRVPIKISKSAPHLLVEGIDLSEPMIEKARRNAAEAGVADRVTFAAADVARLSYPDASFDLIVSSLSQHHWPDPAAGMRELRRILRPTGQIWIYDIRWALKRAERAALPAFDGWNVRRELVRTSWLPIRMIGRLRVWR